MGARRRFGFVAGMIGLVAALVLVAPGAGAAVAAVPAVGATTATRGFQITPVPGITGKAIVGSSLTAVVGAWVPVPTRFAYQWLRNGAPIAGATGVWYQLINLDNGKHVSVQVTATRAGYFPTMATSAAVAVAGQRFSTTPIPTISGTPAVGATLTGSAGTWLPNPNYRAFQWLRDGVPIDGATVATHTVTVADAGSRLSVQVTAMRTGFVSTTKVSDPVVVPAVATVVAAGAGYTQALTSDGTTLAWGSNWGTTVADSSTATPRTTPAPMVGAPRLTQLAASATHALGLTAGGAVWSWQFDFAITCDDACWKFDYYPWQAPVAVTGLPTVRQVALGNSFHYTQYPGGLTWRAHAGHAVALAADGSVWTWGDNNVGELGDGTTTARTTPAQVAGLAGIVQVAAGNTVTYALGSDGTVRAWGWLGGLPDAEILTSTLPVVITGLPKITAIWAGDEGLVALAADGHLWWEDDETSGAAQVPGLTGVTSVAVGSGFEVARTKDGAVWAWGENSSGQLGDGSTTYRGTPARVPGLTGVTSIAAGTEHACAVTGTGEIWCWGNLGGTRVGETSDVHTSPVRVWPSP